MTINRLLPRREMADGGNRDRPCENAIGRRQCDVPRANEHAKAARCRNGERDEDEDERDVIGCAGPAWKRVAAITHFAPARGPAPRWRFASASTARTQLSRE